MSVFKSYGWVHEHVSHTVFRKRERTFNDIRHSWHWDMCWWKHPGFFALPCRSPIPTMNAFHIQVCYHMPGLSSMSHIHCYGVGKCDSATGQQSPIADASPRNRHSWTPLWKFFYKYPKKVCTFCRHCVCQCSAAKRHSVVLTREGDVLVWGHKVCIPSKVPLHNCRDTARSAKALKLQARCQPVILFSKSNNMFSG